MKKLICALIGAASLVASATTYIQTSTTGTAPWRPVKDSVSQAHLADSARKADSSRTAWKADSARIAWFAHAATYADSSRVSGLSDLAKRVDTSWLSDRYLPLTGGVLSGNLRMGSGGISIADGALDVNRSTALGNALTVRTLNSAYPFFRVNSYGSMYWGPGNSDADAAIERTAPGVLTITGSLSGSISGNATTATKLATARTIGLNGDVTGTATAFDGSANITIPTTLPTLLTAGSAGSSTSVPTLTWDAKGRLTAVGSATISILHSQISDWGTYINQALLTTSSPTFGNLTVIGTSSFMSAVDVTGIMYLRNDAGILNSTGMGWNTWFARNGGSPIITATGGFVGNLTGHASLDIPLTGSSAITGSLSSSNSSNLGSSSLPWGVVSAHSVGFPGGLSVTSSSVTLTAASPRIIKVNYNGLTIINLPAPTDGTEFEVMSSGPVSTACINIIAASAVVFTQGSGVAGGPTTTTSNICANYARHFQITSDGSYWFVKY